MSGRTRFFALASPIAIIIVLIGIGIFGFMQYRNNGLDGLQTVPMPSVAITSPQPYSQASVHSPVHVNITANGYKPFKTVELWINGSPMGKQDAALPDTVLKTTFAWQPAAPGEFSLIARVTDQDGNVALSPAVLVDVAAFNPGPDAVNGKGDDNGAGGVYPAADTGGGVGGGAPVPPPGPDQGSAPAGTAGPSLADWITDLTNKQAPNAPGLAASMDACAVNLQIHDLSNNEEGFQVFRSLNNAPGWDKIATLNSQSQSAWISYTDTLVAGNQASYYVAAVNGAGQAQSNPVSVSIDPAKCGTTPDDQQVFQIELKSFDAGGADNPYCYRSFDNTHWGRWPTNGFLDPASLSLNPQATRMTFARKALLGSLPDLSKLGLTLECWGWSGGQLKFLGKVQFSDADLATPGDHSANDGSVGVVLTGFTLNPPSDGKVPLKLPVPPQSVNMPFITAWLSFDPNQCKSHLPVAAQNGSGLFCMPFPGYTAGAKSANPQPYLIWMVLEHTCPAGFNTNCATLADLQNDVTQLGGQVNFVVRQSNINFDDFIGTKYPIDRTSLVVPLKDCPSDIEATVQLDLETPKGSAASAQSNTVTIPCTPPLGATVPVNVTFDSITLKNVKDGESAPETVELYGSFTVITSNFTRFLSLGNSNSGARSDANCPNENVFQGFHTNGLGGVGCLQSFQDGTSNLTEPEMCLTGVEWQCKLNGKATVFKQNNNTIQVPVGQGGLIFLQAEVWDYDNASADDLVCLSFGLTTSRTLLQWKGSAPQAINLSSGDFGSGSCTIHVTIAPAK